MHKNNTTTISKYTTVTKNTNAEQIVRRVCSEVDKPLPHIAH